MLSTHCARTAEVMPLRKSSKLAKFVVSHRTERLVSTTLLKILLKVLLETLLELFFYRMMPNYEIHKFVSTACI